MSSIVYQVLNQNGVVWLYFAPIHLQTLSAFLYHLSYFSFLFEEEMKDLQITTG